MRVDDANYIELVKKLRELTQCTEDEACAALYDCSNSIESAVELIFSKSQRDEWQVIANKRSRVKDKVSSHNDSTKNTTMNGKREVTTVIKPSHANEKIEQKPINAEILKRNQQRSSQKWDPYKDTGDWTGDIIEIVNSETKLDCDDIADALPPGLLDDSSDSETSTVFFAPGILPNPRLMPSVKIGSVIIPPIDESCSIVSTVSEHNSQTPTPSVAFNVNTESTFTGPMQSPKLKLDTLEKQLTPSRNPIPFSAKSTTDSKILMQKDVDNYIPEETKIKQSTQALSNLAVVDGVPSSHQTNIHANPTASQINNATSASTQHQQTNHLPPNVPQYLNQFAHTYQLLSLQQNAGNTNMMDMDQLQMMQTQRMMYDMHQLQQQSVATTAQGSGHSVDAPSVSKQVSSVPNNMAHANNINSSMRPELMQPPLNQTIPMLNTPFPCFGLFPMVSYHLFDFVQNGYTGPYINQQSTTTESQSNHGLTQISQSNQNFPAMKVPTPSSGNYNDLMDMKFPEHMKPGFKEQIQSFGNYSTNQQQQHQDALQKMPGGVGATPNNGMQIGSNYNSSGGNSSSTNTVPPNQNYPQQPFYHLPAAIAATAFMAAVSNHPGVSGGNGASAIQTSSTGQPHHQQHHHHHQNSGPPPQMVMGGGGPGMGGGAGMSHSGQRQGLSRQQH